MLAETLTHEKLRRASILLGRTLTLPASLPEEQRYDVQNVPMENIFVDKARFQPRDDFSEEKVSEIVNNFNPALFKPLIVWKDPKDSKIYVLAGHHRYEALKRMKRQSAPVVFAQGDEQKAVELAWTENQSGRSQTAAENAKYLRKLAMSGRTKGEIQTECKRLYDRSCQVALDLSFLNPRGKTLVDLGLMPRESETFRDMETMAQWIGKLRGRFEELTNSHENEIYDFLRENYKIRGKKFTNFAEFGAFMENIITKRTTFGKLDEVLNINTYTPQNTVEAEYDAEIARAERELKEAMETLKNEREKALLREMKGEITATQRENGLRKYEDAVTIAQRELLRLNEVKGRGIKMARESEMALFGLRDKDTKNVVLQKWNTSTLTAEERETVRRGAVLLGVELSKLFVPAELFETGRNGSMPAYKIENGTQELLDMIIKRIDYGRYAVLKQNIIIGYTNRAAMRGWLPEIIAEYNRKNTPKKSVTVPQKGQRRIMVEVGKYKTGDNINGRIITGFGKSWRYNGEHSADGFHPAFDGFVHYAYLDDFLSDNLLSNDAFPAAVKETLLAKWNVSTLTAEQREKVRRAATLLNISLPAKTVEERVEKRLREKQAQKEFKDSEGRVGGSRKEDAAFKIITSGNLKELEKDRVNAHKQVTKDKVFPKYNVEKMQEAGYSSGAAYLLVQAREALAAKPPDTPEAREFYVWYLEFFQKSTQELRTFNEVYAQLRKIGYGKQVAKLYTGDIAASQSEKSFGTIYGEGYLMEKLMERVLGARFIKFALFDSDAAKDHYRTAQNAEAKSKEEVVSFLTSNKTRYEKEIRIYNERIEKIVAAKAAIEARLPEAKTREDVLKILREEGKLVQAFANIEDYVRNNSKPYRRGEVATTEETIKWLHRGFRGTEEQLQKRIDATTKLLIEIEDALETAQDIQPDWSWANLKTRQRGQKLDGLIINSGKPLDYIRRTGGIAIPDVSVEAIQKNFAFKEVEFGNWVSDSEAREHVRHFLGAVSDLGEAMNVYLPDINRLGGLSIAFGSRGRGGEDAPMAHYEATRKIINLSKKRGDGTIAHEWSHYFDNILAEQGVQKGDSDFASILTMDKDRIFAGKFPLIHAAYVAWKRSVFDEVPRFKRPEKYHPPTFLGFPVKIVYESLAESMSGAYLDVLTRLKPLTEKLSLDELLLHIQQKEAYTMLRQLSQSAVRQTFRIFRWIAGEYEKSFTIEIETVYKNFYYNSLCMDSTYWAEAEEMFARGFEAYIYEKLQRQGRFNNYLVDDRQLRANVYPQGTEREELVELYDAIVKAAKAQFGIGDFRAWSDVRVDETITLPPLEEKSDQQTLLDLLHDTGDTLSDILLDMPEPPSTRETVTVKWGENWSDILFPDTEREKLRRAATLLGMTLPDANVRVTPLPDKSQERQKAPEKPQKTPSTPHKTDESQESQKPASGYPPRPEAVTESAELIPQPEIFFPKGKYEISDDAYMACNLALTRYKNGGRGFLLADGTGFGKTRQILVIAHEYQKMTGGNVLIVTENESIIQGNFKKDQEALRIVNPKVEITTYTKVADGLYTDRSFALVAFDEAHNLKNSDSLKTIASGKLKTDHTLFATATPMDTVVGAAYFISAVTNIPKNQVFAMLGFRVETKTIDGQAVQKIVLDKNTNFDVIKKNIIKVRQDMIESGAMVRRVFPFYGDVRSIMIPLTEEQRQEDDQIWDSFEDQIEQAKEERAFTKAMNLAGQRSGELSRLNEPRKIETTYDLVKEELAKGKQVVVIAEGINTTTISAINKTVRGTIETLVERLKREGIGVSEGYGANKNAKVAAIADFQSGKNKVIIGTPQSISTGIDLDDQRGNAPRALVMVTASYSGNTFQQILGRVSRRNTLSPAEVIILYTESVSDRRRKEIVDKKLEVLRLIQSGKAVMDAEETEGLEQSVSKIQGGTKEESSENITRGVAVTESGDKAAVSIKPHGNGLLVYGNTFPLRETLKNLGGRWNGTLKGWIFPPSKMDELNAALKITEQKPESAVLAPVVYTTEADIFLKRSGYKYLYLKGNTMRVDKEIRELGGVWNFKAKAWQFPSWQKDALEAKLGIKLWEDSSEQMALRDAEEEFLQEWFEEEGVSLQENGENESLEIFMSSLKALHCTTNQNEIAEFDYDLSKIPADFELRVAASSARVIRHCQPPPTMPTVVVAQSDDFFIYGAKGFPKAFAEYFFASESQIAHILLNFNYQGADGILHALFWHEYAHHIYFGIKAHEHLAFSALMEAIEQTASYQTALAQDKKEGKDYWATEEELWARAAGQFFLIVAESEEDIQDLESIGIQWSDDEFAPLQPMIVKVLQAAGFTFSNG